MTTILTLNKLCKRGLCLDPISYLCALNCSWFLLLARLLNKVFLMYRGGLWQYISLQCVFR